MTTPNRNAPSAPPNVNGNRPQAPAEAGAVMRLQTRRLSYKTKDPECRAFPVAGWLLDRLDLVVNDKPRTAYVVRLTSPSKGADQEDKLHDVAVGQELLLWGTWELDKELSVIATHPSQVAWVCVTPDKEIPHPKKKGQTLWSFKIDVGTTPRARAGFCLAPGRQNAAPALPPSGGAGPTAGENDAADDVPFS